MILVRSKRLRFKLVAAFAALLALVWAGVGFFGDHGTLVPLAALSLLLIVLGRMRYEEQAEQYAETRFASYTELSSDWYWEQDESYRFTLFAGSGLNSAGVDFQKHVGKLRWDDGAVPVGDGGKWDKHIATLDAREPFADFVFRRIGPRGEPLYFQSSGQPIFDEHHRFKGYRGIGKDVTREMREEQLLALEHRVVRCLAEADGAASVLRAVMQAVCETQGWELGRYFAVSKPAGVLRLAEVWRVPDPRMDPYVDLSHLLKLHPGEGVAGKVWQSGEPMWVADLTTDPRGLRRAFTVEAGLRGAFAFPVIAEGETLGVFIFSSREVREPDQRLLDAARVIGSQLGQFMRRKDAEEILRESEERFRSLTQLTYDAFWEQDAEYRFTRISGSSSHFLGVANQQFVGRRRWDLNYINMSQADWAEHIATLDARKPFKDFELCRIDGGRKMWISLSGEPVFDEKGTFKGYRGVTRNITARKRSEEELQRFRLAMDMSGDMILLIDRATMRFVDVNETACNALGYSREELLRLRPADILCTDTAELEKTYDEMIQNGSSQSNLKSQYRRRDGALVPFESTRRVLRSGNDWIIVAILRDIRERIAAEQALRRSNERFNLAVRATNDVIWDWNLLADEVWWNENLTKVFDHWRTDIDTTGSFRLEGIHPEDRERVTHGIEELIASSEENWSDEYRFRRADGSYAHVLDRGHVVRDEAGKAVRMIGAMTDITMRKEAEERLAYLAQFDSLTGLPNRHLFRDRLSQAMVRATRVGRPMAVLFIDLDRFKLVNDTLGHGAGDRLLKEASKRLQDCVRSGDTVGRFGGDEFGAILADLARPADASLVAQKVIDALSHPFQLDAHETYVTASIGITLFPTDGDDAGALIMNADTAMYRAKEQGRNTYQYFTREMNERAMQRVKMEASLRRAIERSEFLLHYQPKVRLDSGEVCGFEALLRRQEPDGALISPVEFIPVLEDTGLIVPVGEWVMREVCAQIRRWQDSGLRVPPIAVNLSARQFQQKGLESTVHRILRDSRINPSLIQFELTESLLMKDAEGARQILQGLKKSKVRISVDDFGTGYSSLNYLKRFPIDALKIDRTFIRDVTHDPDDRAITLAIIGMAHSLKLKVIAEGVETKEQLQFLSAHGCDEIQGFLFSEPVDAGECARVMQEGRKLGRAHGRVNGGEPHDGHNGSRRTRRIRRPITADAGEGADAPRHLGTSRR
jgi:diguanylate cyclase (GGDEF)-like protein/PAS domain S-box-containing protein